MDDSIASYMGKYPLFGLGALILILGAVLKINWLLYVGVIVAIVGLALPHFMRK